jgi:hypothetical protein
MLNQKLWDRLGASRELREAAPSWVRLILDLPFIEIQKLPQASSADIPSRDTMFCPTLEFAEITSSYLGFLRTQIRLEPRGKEWADVLAARLKAIVPFENQKLYHMTILRMHEKKIESFFARLHPDDLKIVHIECC